MVWSEKGRLSLTTAQYDQSIVIKGIRFVKVFCILVIEIDKATMHITVLIRVDPASVLRISAHLQYLDIYGNASDAIQHWKHILVSMVTTCKEGPKGQAQRRYTYNPYNQIQASRNILNDMMKHMYESV